MTYHPTHPHLTKPPTYAIISSSSHQGFPGMNLSTFLELQLTRILGKSPTHASGPRKPDLSDQDTGNSK